MVVLTQLEFWDAGNRALSKFDHILPTCQAATDGTLLCFSYEDRSALFSAVILLPTVSWNAPIFRASSRPSLGLA